MSKIRTQPSQQLVVTTHHLYVCNLWPRNMRCRTWFPCGDSTTCQAEGGMAALGPLKIHLLGCPKFRGCWHPTYLTDFQRPQFQWTFLETFRYTFQKFKSVGYVSNCCGLPYMSAQLICHELQPQFAAHTKLELEQEHSSSKITQVDADWCIIYIYIYYIHMCIYIYIYTYIYIYIYQPNE